MFGAMVETAVLFLAYNHIQRLIRPAGQPDSTPMTMSQLCFAGALSGSLLSFLLTPIELVKCQLQVAPAGSEKYSGPWSVVLHNFRTNGLAGFYRGHTGTFFRETGGGLVWFGVYEAVCRWQLERAAEIAADNGRRCGGGPAGSAEALASRARTPVKDDLGPVELMVAGAAAGLAFKGILFPTDLIKSQMQTEDVH
ncbi:MAG: mitochondrial carrier domain-containing protein, partial [Olpidium bornovanus]